MKRLLLLLSISALSCNGSIDGSGCSAANDGQWRCNGEMPQICNGTTGGWMDNPPSCAIEHLHCVHGPEAC
jgi:hypothetical protein